MEADDRIVVAPTGPTSAAHRAWRRGGGRRLTLVAKATLALVPDGMMTFAAPEPVQMAEGHHRRSPMASIRAAAEHAPEQRQVDLLFAGSAYATGGQPVRQLKVRWALVRGDVVLFDKSLTILGDRTMTPGAQPSPPEPFVDMPLIYERAFGGIGCPENPLGTGTAPGPDGRLILPNVVHDETPPGRPLVKPAGFAPISSAWPVRKRYLGAVTRTAVARPDAALDGVDSAYFQAAPEDQRLVALVGDEVIMLHHLDPEVPLLTTQLPGLIAAARVSIGGAPPELLRLILDTLFVDSDARRCHVLFRASVEVPVPADVAAYVAVGGGGVLPHLPDPRELGATAPVPVRAPEDMRVGRAGTMLIEGPSHTSTLILEQPSPARSPHPLGATARMGPATQRRAGLRPPLPFDEDPAPQPSSTDRVLAPLPGAPWSGVAPGPTTPVGTVALDETLVTRPALATPVAPASPAESSAERVAAPVVVPPEPVWAPPEERPVTNVPPPDPETGEHVSRAPVQPVVQEPPKRVALQARLYKKVVPHKR